MHIKLTKMHIKIMIIIKTIYNNHSVNKNSSHLYTNYKIMKQNKNNNKKQSRKN